VNLRSDERFEVAVKNNGKQTGFLSKGTPVTLVVALGKEDARILALRDGEPEQELARVPRKMFAGDPSEIRVGKMPNTLKPEDHAEAGAPGVSRCQSVRVLGE
jgi:hypothetical protein